MKNIFLIQPNGLLKKIYPKALWNYDRSEKVIYLTFDDGPVPSLTDWVLDELQKVNAKATFFCVGANILKHPTIFDRIRREGHQTGNHTMFHTKGLKTTVSNYIKEAETCRKLVNNNLFRPPYGRLKLGQYRALMERGYKIILWDVISYDYEKITEKACARNVISNTRNGSIVLFHDNLKAEKNLKYTLPLYLEHYSKLGYEFRSLT